MNKKHKISRRDFLKSASLFSAAMLMGNNSIAAVDNYTGPLWLFINAEGGWDPTLLCDPKGYAGPLGVNDPDRINNYAASDIQHIGNISYAPPPEDFRPGGVLYNSNLYSTDTFFRKYFSQLLVVNGVDSQTNIHRDGQRYNLSGKNQASYPCFNALLGASLAAQRTMPFITYGGYSETAGLTTAVKMSSTSLNALFEIAYPNRSLNPRLDDGRVYLADDIQSLIQQTNLQRLQRQLSQQELQRPGQALQKLFLARQAPPLMQLFAEQLLDNPPLSLSQFNGRKRAYRLYEQGRTALIAYAQGLTAAANLHLSGFDTHAKNDETQYPLLMDYLQAVDAILEEAAKLGVQDRIIVVMTSDFGRAPFFNEQDGKDHWPVSSVMLMGNSIEKINGNRIIGATTSQFRAIPLDPVSLLPDINGNNATAITLSPAHIHAALRQLAGIGSHALSLQYPLETGSLNLL
ncbi:MAG: DUF1501 domain-containing protein [Gammaproteobacteria bacterium]|nr:DUF1501 domain-containing protein [Gammaproteobacteria bacterium]